MSQLHDFYLFIYSFMHLFFASQILLKIICHCMTVTLCIAFSAGFRMNLKCGPFKIWVCLNQKQDVTYNLSAFGWSQFGPPSDASTELLLSLNNCSVFQNLRLPLLPVGGAISLGLWLHLKRAKLFHSQDHSRMFPHSHDHICGGPSTPGPVDHNCLRAI